MALALIPARIAEVLPQTWASVPRLNERPL